MQPGRTDIGSKSSGDILSNVTFTGDSLLELSYEAMRATLAEHYGNPGKRPV